jgi:hypothetical protein
MLHFSAFTPPLFYTSTSSHHSMPHLDCLPLRSSDLSFEAEITGTPALHLGSALNLPSFTVLVY